MSKVYCTECKKVEKLNCNLYDVDRCFKCGSMYIKHLSREESKFLKNWISLRDRGLIKGV